MRGSITCDLLRQRWRKPCAYDGHCELAVDDQCAEGEERDGDGRGEDSEDDQWDRYRKEDKGCNGINRVPHVDVDTQCAHPQQHLGVSSWFG
jgi:hypothetical protein